MQEPVQVPGEAGQDAVGLVWVCELVVDAGEGCPDPAGVGRQTDPDRRGRCVADGHRARAADRSFVDAIVGRDPAGHGVALVEEDAVQGRAEGLGDDLAGDGPLEEGGVRVAVVVLEALDGAAEDARLIGLAGPQDEACDCRGGVRDQEGSARDGLSGEGAGALGLGVPGGDDAADLLPARVFFRGQVLVDGACDGRASDGPGEDVEGIRPLWIDEACGLASDLVPRLEGGRRQAGPGEHRGLVLKDHDRAVGGRALVFTVEGDHRAADGVAHGPRAGRPGRHLGARDQLVVSVPAVEGDGDLAGIRVIELLGEAGEVCPHTAALGNDAGGDHRRRRVVDGDGGRV